MKSYKDPSFQERVGRAAEAKQKALDQLRSRPAADLEALARRQAARLARETAQAEKRAAKAAAAEAPAETAAPEAPAGRTDAEKKAARDARYAARKSRK